MRGTDPPCEGCFPGIHENNVDVWEIYQLACIDAMGISPEGVISICNVMGVSDVKETLYKVGEIVRTIRLKQEELKESQNAAK